MQIKVYKTEVRKRRPELETPSQPWQPIGVSKDFVPIQTEQMRQEIKEAAIKHNQRLIFIYTDGSCAAEQNIGSSAYAVIDGHTGILLSKGKDRLSTKSSMMSELKAVVNALREGVTIVKDSEPHKIVIFTDHAGNYTKIGKFLSGQEVSFKNELEERYYKEIMAFASKYNIEFVCIGGRGKKFNKLHMLVDEESKHILRHIKHNPRKTKKKK